MLGEVGRRRIPHYLLPDMGVIMTGCSVRVWWGEIYRRGEGDYDGDWVTEAIY